MARTNTAPAEEEPVLNSTDKMLDELTERLTRFRAYESRQCTEEEIQKGTDIYLEAIKHVMHTLPTHEQFAELRRSTKQRMIHEVFRSPELKAQIEAKDRCDGFVRTRIRFAQSNMFGYVMENNHNEIVIRMKNKRTGADNDLVYTIEMDHREFLSAVDWGRITLVVKRQPATETLQ